MKYRIKLIATAALLIVFSLSACRQEEGTAKKESAPATDEQKRAQGDALLKQMSDKLKSLQSVAFSTTESIERVRRNNEKVIINQERQITIRRPDRVWFRVTGDRDLDFFYDGKMVTLVSHKEKVFGELPAPPTLSETVEMIAEKYDIPMPIADLLSDDSSEALKDEKTTGGWSKRETIGGIDCNVVSYQHPNVEFSLWIPASGDPLPKKFEIKYKTRRGQPTTTVIFNNWNLAPQASDETFARKVPDDYEGIAVIQRASAVLPPPDEAQLEQSLPAAKGAVQPKNK